MDAARRGIPPPCSSQRRGGPGVDPQSGEAAVRIRVVAVDWDVPRWVKRWAVRLAVVAAVLGGLGVIAHASVFKTWTAGAALTAADLNANFAGLDQRTSALEAALSAVQTQL